MAKRTLTAAVVGLALSLSLAGSTMADVGDDIEVRADQELADGPEIDCDPRVCGNPPDFVIFGDAIDQRLSGFPTFPRVIEDIPNIRFRVPLP